MGLYDQKLGTMLYDAGGAVINIRNPKYNAKPDGSTNNTTAFANALTDLQAAGGGTLFIPAGPNFYDIPGGINLASVSVPIVIRGDGFGSWLRFTGILLGFTLNGNQNVRLENFRITGSVTCCIYLNNCSNVQMRNLHLSGATRFDAGFPTTAAVFMNSGCTDILCDRLQVSANGYIEAGTGNPRGLEIVSYTTGTADNIRITRCKIIGTNTEASIVLYNTNNSIVDSNRITQGNHGAASGYGHAIMCYAATGTNPSNRIAGNRIHSCAGSGIYMEAQQLAIVSDNFISEAAQRAITLSNFDDGICARNVCWSSQFGVVMNDSNDSIIADNRLSLMSQIAIYLLGSACTNVKIHGNRCSGSNTGIYETGGTDNSVENNDVTSNTNGLQLFGVGGVVSRNAGHNNTLVVGAAVTVEKHLDVIIAYAATAAFTVTLPDCLKYKGREIIVKKIDDTANVVTVTAVSVPIDAVTNDVSLNAQFKWLRVVSGHDRWWVVGRG